MCTSYYIYLSSSNICREYSKHNQSKRNGKQTRLNTMVLCAIEMINFIFCDLQNLGSQNMVWQKDCGSIIGTKADPISDPKVPIFPPVLQMRDG